MSVKVRQFQNNALIDDLTAASYTPFIFTRNRRTASPIPDIMFTDTKTELRAFYP